MASVQDIFCESSQTKHGTAGMKAVFDNRPHIRALGESVEEFGIGTGETVDGLIDVPDGEEADARSETKQKHQFMKGMS